MGDATFLNLDDIKMLPDQVSDCVLWLRSDDLVTSGSNVTTWNNRVNSNKNAGQATATKQPTLVSNQINGLSAVRFDGTDDCLTIASFDLRVEITVFLVAKNASTAKPFFIEHSANSGSNDGFFVYGTNNDAMNARRTGRANRIGVASWSGTSWSIFSFVFKSSSQYFDAYLGSFSVGLGSGSSGFNAMENNSPVSATLNIGARNDGASLATSADHAELIIYNRPLFDFELSAVTNYLKDRYAL
ncbi:hypothetical protein EBZ39_18960 [bacterium]|nr:hypothetical protein [bacterium]